MKRFFALLAASCAVAALAGCASTDRRTLASSVDEQQPQQPQAPASAAPSQHAVLDENFSQKLDLNADGAAASDEWRKSNSNVGAKDNFSVLHEYGDGSINLPEFLKQAPKPSQRYHFFGDTDKPDDSFISSNKELFQQPGLHLFSFHF